MDIWYNEIPRHTYYYVQYWLLLIFMSVPVGDNTNLSWRIEEFINTDFDLVKQDRE